MAERSVKSTRHTSDLITGINTLETSEGVTYPPNSTQLWADLLYNRHQDIDQIVLAYYTESGHAEVFNRHSVDDLKVNGYFKNGRFPQVAQPTSYSHYMCAISSIVGTNEEMKNSAINVVTHNETRLKLGNPKSLVHFDLSCEINDKNLGIIIDTLNEQPYNYYVLASGRSYHAILDKIVELNMLPGIWGNILEKFSLLSESEYVRDRGAKTAEFLIANSNSPFGLRMSANALITQTLKEVTETPNGFTEFSKLTYLDWGHLSYSVKGLLRFYKGKSPGTGFLRINEKKVAPPPVLVAKRVGQNTERLDLDPSYFTRQPALL